MNNGTGCLLLGDFSPRLVLTSRWAPAAFLGLGFHGLLHPCRFSSSTPLSLGETLKNEYRLLDLLSFRSQIRKNLIDVHRSIIAQHSQIL